MRYALIRDGIVENVCEWDGDADTWSPPAGLSAVPAPDAVAIGWAYDGQDFAAPAPKPRYFNGTTLDFVRLFTAQEVIAWNAAKAAVAAMTPADYADPNQTAMAQFSYFNTLFAETNTIDTSRADAQAGVTLLAALGVIAADRVAAVIAGTPP